jgi:general transcriptional corepressor TUP1
MCFTTDANTVGSVAISPDARHVVAGLHDKSIRIWNIATGLVEQLKGSGGHTDGVYSVTFSPDGKELISGSLDKTVKMWEFNASTGENSTLEPRDGECFRTFEDHAVSYSDYD